MPTHSPKLALILFFLWIVGISFSLQGFKLEYFQTQNLNPTQESFLFESKVIKRLQATAADTNQDPEIIHFWLPGCSCNTLIADHIHNLIDIARNQKISSRIIALKPALVDGDQLRAKLLQEFGPTTKIEVVNQEWLHTHPIPASPSAAVVTTKDVVAYFGSYTSDAYCSTENEAFVESAIERIKQTPKAVTETNVLATGCLCRWNQINSPDRQE